MTSTQTQVPFITHIRSLTFCCFVVFAAAGAAHAQSLTGNVGSANIGAGEQSVEGRVGIEESGNAQGRFHYEYGFSDWYQLRTIAAFRKPEDGDWTFSGLTFENWFQWSEEGADRKGFNGGARLAYTFSDDNRPDTLAFRVTITDRFAGVWEWRTNLIAETAVNDPGSDGAELESRFQLTRAIPHRSFGAQSWRVGAELFSEYGTTNELASLDAQAHQMGPVVKAEWSNGISLQAAVRAGLTEGSDDLMAKIFIGREF